jgi:hypothetical protein
MFDKTEVEMEAKRSYEMITVKITSRHHKPED